MSIEKKFNVISLIIISVFSVALVSFYFLSLYLFKGITGIVICVSGCLAIAITALIFIRYATRNIVFPLKALHRGASIVASEISEGNFGNRIDIKTGDEIEEVAENFNKVVSAVEERAALLKDVSEKEQNVIRELSMLTEMMGFITSEVKFEAILETFLGMVKNLLKASHSGIFMLGEGQEVKLFKTTLTENGGVSLECAKAMLQGRLGGLVKRLSPLRVNDVPHQLPPDHIVAVKNFIAVPLSSPDKKMSAILIAVNKPGGFTEDDEDILFNFAFQAFQTLVIHEELATLAVTDGLTGLNNHRAFQEQLAEEINRAQRYAKILSLILMDIDHFKSFNDIYGHQTGDRVLKEIADLINKNLRTVDFPARYGGEEFVVILPETGCEGGVIVAERIREAVAEHPFITDSGEKVMLAISVGVACYPDDASEKEGLIRKADQALYFAKDRGRNMVRTYQDTIGPIIQEIPEELDEILRDPDLKDIDKIAKGIDSRSHYMKGHSLEVAAYAVMLGKQIKLEQSQISALRIAGVLHDLGNIGIPEYILNKPGYLTQEEKCVIEGHPGLAEMVLKRYPKVEDILPAILYHHERFDGKGYPLGLKGDEIPLLAKILAVVEAYQAMVSPRPHRPRRSKEEAIKELKKESGAQFDPSVVNALIAALQD